MYIPGRLKKLRKYTGLRTHRLAALVSSMKPPYRVQDIHALRLEVKKLKSFLKLFHSVQASSPAGLSPDFFNSIFGKAGEVRELQLLLAYLQHRPAVSRPRLLISLLKGNIQKASAALHMLMRKEGLLPALTELPVLADQVHSEQYKSYIQKRKKQVKKLRKHIREEPAQLHRLRQRMKALTYLQAASGHSSDRYKYWLQQAGRWHDTVRLIDLLQELGKTQRISPDMIVRISGFIKHLRRKGNQQLQQLLKDLPA